MIHISKIEPRVGHKVCAGFWVGSIIKVHDYSLVIEWVNTPGLLMKTYKKDELFNYCIYVYIKKSLLKTPRLLCTLLE